MRWDPREWFSNRQSGMTDGQAEEFYGGGGWSSWNSDDDKTILYPNESSMDASFLNAYGNNNQNGSPSFVSQFSSFADAASKAKGFLSDYSKDKAPSFSGNISGGGAGGFNLAKIPQSANSSFFQIQNQQPTISTAPPAPPKKGFLDYAIPIAQTAASFASLCDIRLKTDIAPLESSDTSDELAEIAFFVKGLRECA